MRGWIFVAVLMAGPALAQEVKLDAAAITAALTGKTLAYDDGSRQRFKADGQTIFDTGTTGSGGSESLGHWAVRGNQYCSVWPPSDTWACYDVTQGSGGIGFVDAAGAVTPGHAAP